MYIVFSGCVLVVPTAHCQTNALNVIPHRKDIMAQGNTHIIIDGALEELVGGRSHGGHQHGNETDPEHDRFDYVPQGKFCFVLYLGSSSVPELS